MTSRPYCSCPHVTIPLAWFPCISSSTHHAVCKAKVRRDLIKLNAMFRDEQAILFVPTLATSNYTSMVQQLLVDDAASTPSLEYAEMPAMTCFPDKTVSHL